MISNEWALMQSFQSALATLRSAAYGPVADGASAVVACLQSVGAILGGGPYMMDSDVGAQLSDWQDIAGRGTDAETVSGSNDLGTVLQYAESLFATWTLHLNSQGSSWDPTPIYTADDARYAAQDFIQACYAARASLF
jgi:hypothetical protein